MRELAASVFLAVCTGCASTAPAETRQPLPFHVALMPLSVEDVRTDRLSSGEGDSTEMHLAPDPQLLSALSVELATTLEERAFAEVSLLELEPTDPGNRDAMLLREVTAAREARELGADLLLRVELSVQPVIRQEKNGTFWLNMPLFLLGGPFCWWLPDRTYFAEAEVSAWFYDLQALELDSSGTPLQAGRGSIASASRRAESLDLSFSERAQGDVGDYLLSVLWPCGFLAVESEELEDSLIEELVDQLGQGLARSTLDQTPALSRGRAPFFLDLTQSGFVRDASGGLVFRGAAYLTPTREIETLGTWSVRLGDEVVVARPFDQEPPPQAEGAYMRYAFESPIEEPVQAACARLKIEAGERSRVARSYTFRVPGKPR